MPPFPALKPTTEAFSTDEIAPRHEGMIGSRIGVPAALGSDYMAESIRVHGLTAGIWRGAKRLARCRPLGGHGFDPVPRP
jgi:hypothetical protein